MPCVDCAMSMSPPSYVDKIQVGNSVEISGFRNGGRNIFIIPKGSTDIVFLGVPACSEDCVVVPQLFHRDGKQIIGTPVLFDARVSTLRSWHGSCMWGFYTGAPVSPDPRTFDEIRQATTEKVIEVAATQEDPVDLTGFVFDDSKVNGDGKLRSWDPDKMYKVSVYGETVEWNGDQLDGWPGYGRSRFDNVHHDILRRNNDPDAYIKIRMYMEHANEDLVFIPIGVCYHTIKLTYELSQDPPDPPIPPVLPAKCERSRHWQKRAAGTGSSYYGI